MKLRILQGGALLTALVFAAGCGGSGSKSSKPAATSPGGKVFAKAGCAGCHTLEAAGAKGQVGPNLDELKPDQSTVERQVRNGGNGMPSFGSRLSSTQISQVATFVSQSAPRTYAVVRLRLDPVSTSVLDRAVGGGGFGERGSQQRARGRAHEIGGFVTGEAGDVG